ncbi:MAG TPA: hypothetical protein VJW55_11155 [Candidatus Angelobacter sp.]|nr:hypothetical protein [Candidatus Angelobacter sp.]
MSACQQQVFNGVTQSRWDCIKQTIQTRTGVEIGSDSGTASKSGFTFQWSFDPAAQTLTIQCMEKPAFIPCESIESRITAIVDGCV